MAAFVIFLSSLYVVLVGAFLWGLFTMNIPLFLTAGIVLCLLGASKSSP